MSDSQKPRTGFEVYFVRTEGSKSSYDGFIVIKFNGQLLGACLDVKVGSSPDNTMLAITVTQPIKPEDIHSITYAEFQKMQAEQAAAES